MIFSRAALSNSDPVRDTGGFDFAIGGRAPLHPMGVAAPHLHEMTVLREDGEMLRVAAKDLAREIEFCGKAPREEFFDFQQIGSDKKIGWVMRTGFNHNGQHCFHYSAFAPQTREIVLRGFVSCGFDDADASPIGKSIYSDESCTQFFCEPTFSPEQESGFFPIIMSISSLLGDEEKRQTYTVQLSQNEPMYVLPEGLPFVWKHAPCPKALAPTGEQRTESIP